MSNNELHANDKITETMINIGKYEWVKPKLFLKLISLANAIDDGIVFERHEDLALAAYVLIDKDKDKNTAVRITPTLLSLFGVTKDQLFSDALANTERLCEPSFTSLDALARNTDRTNKYVLYDENNISGSAVFLLPYVQKLISTVMDGNYYIVPSSTQELIFVKEDKNLLPMLRDTLRSVNRSELIDESIMLSDNVYLFDQKTKLIRIAK